MSTTTRMVAGLLAAGAAALPAAAGDDDEPADEPPGPRVEGEVRAGWRFIQGEDEGRFPQDWGFQDGLRLFDLDVLARDLAERFWLDEAELRASGVGDPNTDCLLDLRKAGVLDVSSGYRRDDFSYRATGDPFPYETVRERSFLHADWSPQRDLDVRAAWDRSDRSGRAYASQYTTDREQPVPPGVEAQTVHTERPFSQVYDDFTVGADWRPGIWRFGLAQSVRLADVEDSRDYDVPAADRGADPVRQSLGRDVDADTWTTSGKAGVSLLAGRLDVTAFGAYTHMPLRVRTSGTSQGYDGSYGDGVSPNGGFSETFSGDNDTTRSATSWRVEAAWRPHPDWELVAAGESDDTVDDAELEIVQVRTFDRPDLDPQTTTTLDDARITDRNQRWSLEGSWDAADGLRLRLGEEFLRQELSVPTDTHYGSADPTDLSSTAWRTLGGVDWDATRDLRLSALAHYATNSDPQTTPVPEQASDWSLRARWQAAAGLTFAGTWRHAAGENDVTAARADLGDFAAGTADLGSHTRVDSVGGTAAWTSGPFSADATVTFQDYLTRTDTSFWETQGAALRRVYGSVAFAGRDLVANANVRYEFTRSLRATAGATRTSATGDSTARWFEMSLGGEYDLAEEVTLGLTLRDWQLDEGDSDADDYSTYAAEVYLTYRF